MPTTTRRAVFTGLGVLSPVGSDSATFWASLRAGTSGIRTVQQFDASPLAAHIAAEIPDFDAKKIVPKEHRKLYVALYFLPGAVQFLSDTECLRNRLPW